MRFTLPSLALCGLMLAPTVALADDFGGGYIGLNAGYSDASDSWSDAVPAGEPDISPEGPSFGVFAGYQADLSGLVVGIETDISFPDLSDNAECSALIDCNIDVQVLSSLRGRAGIAVGPILLYGTGGLALGFIQAQSDGIGGTSSSKSLYGWTLGGGAEAQIGDGVRIGAEYRHSDYGDADVDLGTASGDVSLQTDEFRLRVSISLD